ncbi:MAG: hypothetical protein MJZ37_04615 [Bacilli bacterium]|nr:hypothetical protein [Bacilli bacterium]
MKKTIFPLIFLGSLLTSCVAKVPNISENEIEGDFFVSGNLESKAEDRKKGISSTISSEFLRDYLFFEDSIIFFDNNFDLPSITNDLFISDINCDGYDDICYTNNTKGSSGSCSETVIYDIKNKQLLYHTKYRYLTNYDSKGYDFFSVDECGFLVLNHCNCQSPDNNNISSRKDLLEKKLYFQKNSDKEMRIVEKEVEFKICYIDLWPASFNYKNNSFDLLNNFSTDSGHICHNAQINTNFYISLELFYQGIFDSNENQITVETNESFVIGDRIIDKQYNVFTEKFFSICFVKTGFFSVNFFCNEDKYSIDFKVY